MCRSDSPPATIASKDTSSSHVESDDSFSDSDIDDDDDQFESSHADQDDLKQLSEEPDAPLWISCGRAVVFFGIFFMGVIVSAITFVTLTKLSNESYLVSVSSAKKEPDGCEMYVCKYTAYSPYIRPYFLYCSMKLLFRRLNCRRLPP